MYMRFLIPTVLAFYVTSTIAIPDDGLSLDALNSASFEEWSLRNTRSYDTMEERLAREVIFKTNQFIVKEHNAKGLSWTMALNEYADLTHEEFSTRFGLKARPEGYTPEHTHVPSSAPLADSVDWRTKGAVTPVKNQGSCGSCWAFSTVVSLEGQSAVKTGNLTSFSEQDLVDCVKNVKLNSTDPEPCCMGCQGGLMDYAFKYMIDSQSGHDDTEASYPYSGMNGKCKFSSSTAGPGTVKSFTDVKTEKDLESALTDVGPVSIGVDANLAWQLYHGGVMDPWPVVGCSTDPKKMDHGVAVVILSIMHMSVSAFIEEGNPSCT